MALVMVLTAAACNTPRGAAIQREIVREGKQTNNDIAIVPVTRANVPAIRTWPVTGWSGQYHWLSNGKGPASNVIRTGDFIDLVIWDSQDNSLLTAPTEKNVNIQGLTVSPDGTIFVPYVDEVVVRGLTTDDARRKIQSDLEMIVPSAQVQLAHRPGQSNSVDVVRGVRQPGSYPLPGRDYTILSLLSQAGGVDSSLRNPVVRLIRGSQSYEIRAEALFEDASRNIALRGDDKVIVEEDDRYFIALGATGSERLVYFEKEYITALEAISISGGLADNTADPKGVLILREYPEGSVRPDGTGPEKRQVVFTLDLTSADGLFAARNFEINPNDTVLATESPLSPTRTILALLTSAVLLSDKI
ncbi:polysaccharide biosynthesis/export family protein [Sulfitobacter sp. D35]|uniref:polysaccharide biosynthesis/export family protein n=1 Tax=Sulfitobacter sp. D35 TaxID=3083252 RepID=UPI00296E280C|nr:polysaccharide biosynthesis/export family protein [Sulfitobacter sp. D35]